MAVLDHYRYFECYFAINFLRIYKKKKEILQEKKIFALSSLT